MLPQSKFGLFFWTWKQTAQSWRRPITLLPFTIYAVFQLLLLAGLVFFIYPPFSFIFLPLHRALYGEAALHYPNNFIVLPQLFDTLNIVLSGIMGILVIGVATLLFYASSNRQALKLNVTPVGKRYFHLFAAWLGETGLILLLIFGSVWLGAQYPSVGTYITAFRVGGVVFISAVFAFTTALILIDQQPFWAALAKSAKIFASYAILTFFLVGLPTLVQLPIHFVLSNAATIVRKLNPEIIAFAIGAGVVSSMLSNYFIVGTITHLYRAVAHER
jgi:hypothetical protein